MLRHSERQSRSRASRRAPPVRRRHTFFHQLIDYILCIGEDRSTCHIAPFLSDIREAQCVDVSFSQFWHVKARSRTDDARATSASRAILRTQLCSVHKVYTHQLLRKQEIVHSFPTPSQSVICHSRPKKQSAKKILAKPHLPNETSQHRVSTKQALKMMLSFLFLPQLSAARNDHAFHAVQRSIKLPPCPPCCWGGLDPNGLLPPKLLAGPV